MSKRSLIFIGLAIFSILIVLGGGFVLGMKDKKDACPTQTCMTIYDDHANPSSVNVGVGEAVTFQVNGTKTHIIAEGAGGATHEHTIDGPESPELNNGESWSYTFHEAGTFYFHDHENPYIELTIQVR